MDLSPLNLGIIGAGRIGQLHAANLRNRIPGARLLMVTDAIAAAAEACATKLGIPAHGTDYKKVLSHPDIHAVVICSPTDTHTEIIQAAAAAGKHIFCEKPIDVDLARIDAALAAVKKAGVLFQVGFNRRFDPNFQRVRAAVVQGEIGTPHQVHITSRDPGPPPIEYIRKSGGIFVDMTIHDFDMAQFLVDSPITEIYATGGVRVDPAIGDAGDLDTVVILLKYASGATGIIENCRQAAYGYDQRVEVFGSAGNVRVDNNYPNNAILSTKASVRRDLPLHFFLDRYTDSYITEMLAFLDAIRGGRPSPVSGEAARIPVVMALAARKSIQENRPVRLAEIG
jgi:myo-inositol 2-dehydrogenase/D-chiro-inositol 1-dehydrogenase